MSDNKGYNGWPTYETWLVALWLDNDEASYDWSRDVVRHARDLYDAAEELKGFVEELNPLADNATLFSDLLNSALSEVHWVEIAQAYKQEIEEEEKADCDDGSYTNGALSASDLQGENE